VLQLQEEQVSWERRQQRLVGWMDVDAEVQRSLSQEAWIMHVCTMLRNWFDIAVAMHALLLLHQTNCNYVGVHLVSYGECFVVTVINRGWCSVVMKWLKRLSKGMGGWVDGPTEDKTAVHALPAEGGAAVHCARPTMEREREWWEGESSSFLSFLLVFFPSAKALLWIR
jgi:alpha-L-fucosidase